MGIGQRDGEEEMWSEILGLGDGGKGDFGDSVVWWMGWGRVRIIEILGGWVMGGEGDVRFLSGIRPEVLTSLRNGGVFDSLVLGGGSTGRCMQSAMHVMTPELEGCSIRLI